MLLNYLILHFVCIIIAFIKVSKEYDEILELTPMLKAFPRYMIFLSVALIAPFVVVVVLKGQFDRVKIWIKYRVLWRLSYEIKLLILKFKSRNSPIEQRGILLSFFIFHESMKINNRKNEITDSISD